MFVEYTATDEGTVAIVRRNEVTASGPGPRDIAANDSDAKLDEPAEVTVGEDEPHRIAWSNLKPIDQLAQQRIEQPPSTYG